MLQERSVKITKAHKQSTKHTSHISFFPTESTKYLSCLQYAVLACCSILPGKLPGNPSQIAADYLMPEFEAARRLLAAASACHLEAKIAQKCPDTNDVHMSVEADGDQALLVFHILYDFSLQQHLVNQPDEARTRSRHIFAALSPS